MGVGAPPMPTPQPVIPVRTTSVAAAIKPDVARCRRPLLSFGLLIAIALLIGLVLPLLVEPLPECYCGYSFLWLRSALAQGRVPRVLPAVPRTVGVTTGAAPPMILVTEELPLLVIHTEPEPSIMMAVGVLMLPPW